MSDLLLENVSIDTLQEDPKNTRKHNKRNLDSIGKSLETFGQRRPLVVWNNIVIAGNGTLRAAKSLNWTEIAIARVPDEWTQDQAKAYAIADNRTAELAEWDSELLFETLDELKDVELFDVTGFTDDDIEKWEEPSSLEEDSEKKDSAGALLEIMDVSVGEPKHETNYGEIWEVQIPEVDRTHVLVIVNPIKDWPYFVDYLHQDSLLLLYPDPYITHTENAKESNFVMVQSDEYLAGHLLDKHAALFGEETVRLIP
jgi:hypothetical protein